MNALDYEMGFGYKAQDGTFYGPNGSVGLYHLGNDYFAPLNSPLILQGTQLGLSGATGKVGGPHVHVAKWKPGNVGGYYIQAYDKSYFDPSDVKGINGVVSETGYDASAAGNYVRVKADNGYTYEFFHMNRIDVKVGDKIGDIMLNKAMIEQIFVGMLHKKPVEADYQAWNGLPWLKLVDEIYHSEEWAIQDKALKNPTQAQTKLEQIKQILG